MDQIENRWLGPVLRVGSGVWENVVDDILILLNVGLIFARRVLAQFITELLLAAGKLSQERINIKD